MIFFSSNHAISFSDYHKWSFLKHIQTQLVGTCGCRPQVTRKCGDSWWISGSSAKVQWPSSDQSCPISGMAIIFKMSSPSPISSILSKLPIPTDSVMTSFSIIKTKGRQRKATNCHVSSSKHLGNTSNLPTVNTDYTWSPGIALSSTVFSLSSPASEWYN